jgi:hypothetical protein
MIGRSCEPPDKEIWNVSSSQTAYDGCAWFSVRCGKDKRPSAHPYQEGASSVRESVVGGKATETPCGYATESGVRRLPLRNPRLCQLGVLGTELVSEKLAPRKEI